MNETKPKCAMCGVGNKPVLEDGEWMHITHRGGTFEMRSFCAKPPKQEAGTSEVEQLRRTVRTLAEALRRMRDELEDSIDGAIESRGRDSFASGLCQIADSALSSPTVQQVMEEK